MSLESIVDVSDRIAFWCVTVGVVLAFIGAGASIVFRIYNARLTAIVDENTRREKAAADKAIAEANARAAEAELETAKLAIQAGWRTLDEKTFLNLLKGTPGGLTTHIWYKPEDDEAHRFAQQIWNALAKAHGWKETLQEIQPIPPDAAYDSKIDSAVEVTMRCWQNPPSMSVQNRAAFFALQEALVHSQGGRSVGMAAHSDSSLPEGHCRIVIGQEGGRL
jgi:hypothetical protein